MIIQDQKADLENQLQLLGKESSQLTERMQALESNIKEKNAIIETLQYGTQGKCGVCSKTGCKIISSHPYSRVILETILIGQIIHEFMIYNKGETSLPQSACRWKHLYYECDHAAHDDEESFSKYHVSVHCRAA